MCTLKPLQMVGNFGQKTILLWSLPAGSSDNKVTHRNVLYYCNYSNSIKILRHFSKLLPNARKALNSFFSNSKLVPSPQADLLLN